jgi:hypothetical protein
VISRVNPRLAKVLVASVTKVPKIGGTSTGAGPLETKTADCGAAVRDTTGRTYASANVARENLTLSAVQLAVGQAVASGAVGIEAVVIFGDFTQIDVQDIEIVRSIGGIGVPVHQLGTTGELVSSQLT